MLKAPAMQNVTDTINTLSSRLSSATLLEDKRAAILGLRSFAKGYPASVASSSLRDLIICLREHGAGLNRDGEGDVDTIRSVLETLLMLFNPDPSSPEASEDIALWLADEFSQRQDNITILLDFLETPDYYARMYSLQLLAAISSARPERTQQCILSAPLGTTRLVSVLDDTRDAVRDAALLLLVDLTSVSQTDLQKLLAFEDAFPRLFRLMDAEGGIAEGGLAIQDCLSLLANLIRHSSSNQTLFRETGCMTHVVRMIRQAGTWDEEGNELYRANREKNAWGLLAVLRLFLEPGELGTKMNQDTFWQSNVIQLVLDLSFNKLAPLPIRSSAMRTCAEMITSNPPLQESFAALTVILDQPAANLTNGARKDVGRVYIIEALLGLLLGSSATSNFDLRMAASALVKAYCLGHDRIRHHFLQRAIAGYVDGEDESTNVLSTLISGPQTGPSNDPFRFVFAADILAQLIIEDDEAKAMLHSVTEGNADKGEDVVSSIQILSGHVAFCLQSDQDPRVSIAYFTLLTIALFDSQTLINDCLAEGSALLGQLLQLASKCKDSAIASDPVKSLLPGLSALLLGIIYEFSTKDSPISRRTIQPLLHSKLGRQRYFEALRQLRSHPIVRDSEFSSQDGAANEPGSLILDAIFVELFKEEYGRLRRAIDKDPGIEVVDKDNGGVDRDILDELRTQIASKEEAIQQLEQGSLFLRQDADKAGADHRKEMQSLQASHRTMESEVDRIRRINESLQQEHDTEMGRLREDMNREVERLQNLAKTNSDSVKSQHDRELERLKGQYGASLASERSLWEEKLRKAADQGMQEARKRLAEMKDAIQERDNELVVTKQALKNSKDELQRMTAQLDSQTRSLTSLTTDHQKLKERHTGLQHVQSQALVLHAALRKQVEEGETRYSTVSAERDTYHDERSALALRVEELDKEVAGLKLELQTERRGYGDLEEELDAAKKSTKSLEIQTQVSHVKIKELEAELEKAKAAATVTTANKSGKAKGDDKKVKELEAKITSLSKQADDQAEDAKKARSELDDMLMVLADIEAKRDEYKERLKLAGEHVTDDEEEEGDDAEAAEEHEDVD